MEAEYTIEVPKHASNTSENNSESRMADRLCDASNHYEQGTLPKSCHQEALSLSNTAEYFVGTQTNIPAPAERVYTWIEEMPDLEDASDSEDEDSDDEDKGSTHFDRTPQPLHPATPPPPPWWDDEMPSLADVSDGEDSDYEDEDKSYKKPPSKPAFPTPRASPPPPFAAPVPHPTGSNDPDELYTLDDDDYYVFDESEDDENHTPFQEIRDPEGHSDPDDGDEEEATFTSRKGVFVFPPTLEEAESAFKDITRILKPPRAKGQGYKDPGLDRVTTVRLEGIRMFLGTYVRFEKANPGHRGNWTKASEETVAVRCEKKNHAVKLREWARAFIDDREEIPENKYGRGSKSAIDDEDFAQEIHLHLQGIGKYVKAEDIVRYCEKPHVLARLKRTKTISLATARRWMEKMGYRWKKNFRGQYVDGHERKDVVEYRQNVFLPAMKAFEERLRQWSEEHGWDLPPTMWRAIVIWFHDESTFYAHDRRQSAWYHKNATPTPYRKGEGLSLMVADFVSADHGWLRSPDGKESARVVFRAGVRREGYFTCEDILEQVRRALFILADHFSNEDHVFVYDNATTHLKRADEALSATKMPKGPSKTLETNFGVLVNVLGPDGKPRRDEDGKYLKKKIPMRNGKFADGTVQEFYFPEGHPLAGLFKGMALILTERGYDVSRKKVQCGKSFANCPEGATDCCCRRMLYSKPDFVAEEPLLRTLCESHGVPVLFLPKFHCELNFIEQCWGYAKRRYRLLPESSKEEDLERNVLASLEEVPLISMRRFATRSLRFMDAYRKNLNGAQAAWAAKKYRGHRTIPDRILVELEKANI
ncbi:hypothetical protein LshimejAT787_1500950 [Lyophyllum shimeji]|uniref:Uncharacterized protein n=1 Tax=Lyophyllum shimeji TaxID=47721 RepID=A0A9P3PYF3_LYOSH|nr:hypothetical protein LshimejAT787_1500950 [Lyophyllum shimeji]